MKWRGTLVIWILLFAPLSIYNIFGSPIFFPNHSTQYRDPKTLHYNFSMASPVFVAGNFSVGFLLDKAPSYYRVSAYVNVAEDYMSFGAYGVFHLIANISENGFYSSNRGLSSRFDNVLPPLVPPTGYGLAASGTLPQNTSPTVFTHLQQGSNSIFLNFTFASFLDHYGPGYYKLDIGPLFVS